MIKNSLKYTINYYDISAHMKAGFEFLKNNNLQELENGRYDILGEDAYVNIQDYRTKPEAEGKWEAHKRYIDIQYIIEGTEKIGVGAIQDFTTVEPYNMETDVEFLKTEKPYRFIPLKEDDYLILYPFDVHMPQISIEKPTHVKKAVVKVRIK